MEVHAHTHTPRKKWTHYFWEFLMLFLAVFCGFLAEYYLEHKIEHNREKQFIKSLVKDIESDTARLSVIAVFRHSRINIMDSLTRFFAKNSSSTIPLHAYNLMGQLRGHVSFYQNSGTLDQLKNSGGLRMIRKRAVVDSIQYYDQQIKRMVLRDMYETDEMRYTNRLANQLLDGRILTKIHADTTFFNMPSPSQSENLVMNTQYLGEYLNSLSTFRFVVHANMQLQAVIKQNGVALLGLIKKEYHLE